MTRSGAATPGVRARHVLTTSSASITHEVVVTARLLVFWKMETLDAIASGGDVGALIKKRVACEEHLERLLATLDEVVVREQLAAGDKPTVKKTAQQ